MIRAADRQALIVQSKVLYIRLRQSKFARQAVWLFALNVVSRAFGFFGSIFAAKCLGPTKLGISGLVLATSQQVSLTYDGGFNVVGVRKIAADKEASRSVIETINTFQLGMALIASVLWLAFLDRLAPAGQRLVWALGIPSLVLSATSLTFVFQGLEMLPIQTAIGAMSSVLIAGVYFLLFSPGMFLGADLLVLSAVGALAAVAAWAIYYRMFGRLPIGHVRWRSLLALLRESWRYWALAVTVYCYSMFQIPLIVYLVGASEAGVFRSAFGLAAGVELLFNSINSLLLARLVNWKKMGVAVMWRRQHILFVAFLSIGALIVGVLLVAAPVVYAVLLGDAFKGGVVVFQILLVGRLVVFLGQIFAYGLIALGQDNQFLLASILGATFSIAMNFIVIPKYGILGAAVVSVSSELLLHSLCYLFARSEMRRASSR